MDRRWRRRPARGMMADVIGLMKFAADGFFERRDVETDAGEA